MNEKVRNHYMFRLGMSGEILSLKVRDRAPAPPSSAGDELRHMLADDLIRYFRHPDRKRTYRICDPAGFDWIDNMDPRLSEHVEVLAGKKGARYPGGKEYRLKKRREAMLINAFLDAGFNVDGAGFENKEHLFYSPTLTDATEIIRSAPKRMPLYISGPILKRKTQDMQHTRREMSIQSGTIFSETGPICVYIISTPKFRWYAASETQTAIDIRRMYEDALDIERSRDRRLKAVIFAETGKVAEDLLKMSGKEESRMDPTAIYRLCYVIPTEDESHAMDVAKMLTIPDWRNKINKILGLSSSPGNDEDGRTESGKPIYNLLCCNLGRIKEIESRIRRKRCRLIVHDWQKEVLESVYDTGLDAMVLSPSHFRGLLLAAERE